MSPLRRTLFALAATACGACTERLSVPPEAMVRCDSNADCPPPLLLCDLEQHRCVETIVPGPKAVLVANPPVGSRGQQFEFVAGDISDAGTGTVSFAWEIEGTPGDPDDFDIDTGTAGTLTRRLDIPREAFCPSGGPCVPALGRTVRVRVTNAKGRRAEARTTVVITNAPPVPDFGEDLFVSEEGVPRVTLDVCGGLAPPPRCTTTDPDGDALSYGAWRQVSGTPVIFESNDGGRARFAPPANWTRPLIFEADVSDGLETRSRRLRVYQSAVAWAGTGVTDETFRLHPDTLFATGWQLPDGGRNPFNSLDSLVAQDDGYWFGDSEPRINAPGSGKTIVVHLDRRLNEIERWEVPANSHASRRAILPSLVPPPPGGTGCAVFLRVDGGNDYTSPVPYDFSRSGFVRFGRDAGLLDRMVVPTGGYYPFQVLPVGGTGDCWTVGAQYDLFDEGGGELGRLRPDGTWRRVATMPSFPILSAVEPDGTLWVGEKIINWLPDGGYPTSYASYYRMRIHRYSPQEMDTPFDYPDGGWLWSMAVDSRGALWGTEDFDGTIVRVLPSGAVTRYPVLRTAYSQIAWDPIDRALWVASSRLYRLREVQDGGLVIDDYLPVEALPANTEGFRLGFGDDEIAIDPGTGAASMLVGGQAYAYTQWVTAPIHLKRFERVPDNHLGELAGDPTTGHAWSVTATNVRRISATGRVLLELSNARDELSRPPTLVVERSGRLWLPTVDAQGPGLRAIDVDGTASGSIRLPVGVVSLTSSADVACGVGADGSAFRVRLADGGVEQLSLSNERAYLSATASDGQCWFVTNRPPPMGAGDLQKQLVRFSTTAPAERLGLAVDQPNGPAGPIRDFQVGRIAVDSATGRVFIPTQLYPGNISNVRIFASGAGEIGRIAFQNADNPDGGAQPARLRGQSLGAWLRQACRPPSSACSELWVPTHLGQVLTVGGGGTLNDQWPLPVAGPYVSRFSLVP